MKILLSAMALLLIGLISTAFSAAPRSGADVYKTYCALCHSGGWQGAPVANDKAEWEPRMEKGLSAMLKITREGLNGMPANGTCADCTDEELIASIKEMTQF
jgi:cytochrome c5